MAKKTRVSPFEAVKMAVDAQKKNCLSWYDKLSDEDKKWCDQLKVEYIAGKHAHLNAECLARVVNQELRLSVSGNAFRLWLKK